MAKYKMADDLDKMKDESLQRRYEKLSKGILYIGVNVVPSTIENLKNSINQLAQQASAAGIMLDIGALKINLEIVEFQVEYNQSKIITETNAKDKKELTEEDKQKNADDTAGRGYKTFDAFHKDFLKKQKEDNKDLDKVLEATEAGRELTEEEKKKSKKTPEQIEEEKLRWQHIELVNKIAEDRHKYHSESIEKIDQQIAKLDAHHHHTEIATLENQKKHHEQHRDLAKTKKTECAEHYHERSEQAKKICRGLEASEQNGFNKDVFQNLSEWFEKVHNVAPEEINNRTKTKGIKEKDIHASKDMPAPEAKQKLDENRTISDSDKTPNKLSRNITKQFIKNFSDTTSTVESQTISSPSITPINPNKEQNKGKIVRRSI